MDLVDADISSGLKRKTSSHRDTTTVKRPCYSTGMAEQSSDKAEMMSQNQQPATTVPHCSKMGSTCENDSENGSDDKIDSYEIIHKTGKTLNATVVPTEDVMGHGSHDAPLCGNPQHFDIQKNRTISNAPDQNESETSGGEMLWNSSQDSAGLQGTISIQKLLDAMDCYLQNSTGTNLKETILSMGIRANAKPEVGPFQQEDMGDLAQEELLVGKLENGSASHETDNKAEQANCESPVENVSDQTKTSQVRHNDNIRDERELECQLTRLEKAREECGMMKLKNHVLITIINEDSNKHKKECASKSSQIKDLEEKLSNQEDANVILVNENEMLNAFRKENVDLQKSNQKANEAEAKIEQLETALKNLGEINCDLQMELNRKKDKIADLTTEINSKSQTERSTKQKLAQYKTKCEKLDESYETKCKNLESCEAKCKTLEFELRNQQQTMGTRIRELESSLRVQQYEVTKKISESKALQSRNDQLESEKNSYSAELNDLRIQNQQLNEQLAIKEQMEKRSCMVPSVLFNDARLTSILGQLRTKLQDSKISMKPKDSDAIGEDDNIVIPCINSSRIGTDITVAFGQMGNIRQNKVILLIFNHLAAHNSRITTPTREKLNDASIKDQCHAIIDLVFWQDNLYDCESNNKGIQEITYCF